MSDAVRIVSETKTPEDFNAVFGHEPSANELHQALDSVDDLVHNGSGTVVLERAATGISMADQTLNSIVGAKGRAVTLVGHNSSGDLRYADGSVLSINQAAAAAPADSLVLILSCSASVYIPAGGRVVGPTQRIAYEDAAAIERAFYKSLSLPLAQLSHDDLDRAMTSAINTVSAQQHLTVVRRVAGVGTAVTGGGYVYIETTR